MLAGLQLPLAFLLDVVFGDPQGCPRPDEGIERGIALLERIALRLSRGERSRRLAGWCLALLSCAVVYGAFRVALHAFDLIHPLPGWGIRVFLIYTTIGVRGPARSAGRVYRNLLLEDLAGARDRLAELVGGRPVRDMDRGRIVTSTIEFVASRTTEGVVAPLFYAFLGGAELAVAYRAACLLHARLGRGGGFTAGLGDGPARLYGVVEFLPDRIAVLLLVLAAGFTGRDVSETLRVLRECRARGEDGGMSLPEAGFVGALGLMVVGPTAYGGLLVPQDYTGGKKEPTEEDIREAVRLLYVISMLMITLCTLLVLTR